MAVAVAIVANKFGVGQKTSVPQITAGRRRPIEPSGRDGRVRHQIPIALFHDLTCIRFVRANQKNGSAFCPPPFCGYPINRDLISVGSQGSEEYLRVTEE